MAGYNGYSKSNNAVFAERCGRFPMTTAKKIVADVTGISQSEASGYLKVMHSGEWHHTSKRYNAVDYYDTTAVIKAFELSLALELPFNASFVGAFLANGLEVEADPLYKLRNPKSYESSVDDFIDAVKSGEYEREGRITH